MLRLNMYVFIQIDTVYMINEIDKREILSSKDYIQGVPEIILLCFALGTPSKKEKKM